MAIDAKFDPTIAQLGIPSKDNGLTILGRALGQYSETKKRDDAIKFNQSIKSKADSRAEKVATANIANMKFGQELDEKKFSFDKTIKTNADSRANKIATANIANLKAKNKTSSTPNTKNIKEVNELLQKRNGTKEKKETRTIVRTGMKDGRKVVQYSDGSIEYGN